MAIGLRRKVRLDSRRERQIETRRVNGALKQKERGRRDARMHAAVAAVDPAKGYSPAMQSWISVQLGKRFGQVTPEEIAALVG